MRVWDIHPGYLSGKNLLGQHAEIHALFSVIDGGRKGYAAHPETLRWKGNRPGLTRAHDLTVLEMKLRGYNHASPCPPEDESSLPLGTGAVGCVDSPVDQVAILGEKYRQRNQEGRIPLPGNAYVFWAQHKYSVMARGYNYYRDIKGELRGKKQFPLPEAEGLIEHIHCLMLKPVTEKALANVIDHLWGYFKRDATACERQVYLNRSQAEPAELVAFIYGLALKYDCRYLLHSTVFADFVPSC